MHTLLALALTLLAAAAPAFPWASYSDISAMPIGPACDGEAVVVTIGEDWQALSGKNHDVFLHKGPDGKPDYAFFTAGTSVQDGGDGKIVVKRVLTYAETLAQYPNPCTWAVSLPGA